MTKRNSYIQFLDAIFPAGGIRRYFKRNKEDLKYHLSEDMSLDEVSDEINRRDNHATKVILKGSLLGIFQILTYVPLVSHGLEKLC